MPRTSVLACILMMLHFLLACGATPRPKQDAPGSVWVVESGTTKLYLCGTIHILRKQDYPLPPAYDRAYADSQRLVFELPPGSARDPKLAQAMQAAGTLAGATKLKDVIPANVWTSLEKWAAGRKVPMTTFENQRPWLTALVVSMTEYVILGADPNRGVDQEFERRAETDHKPGEGLETMQQQLDLFIQLSAHEQAELLNQTLGEVKTLPQIFNNMIGSWRDGDADALHKMLFEEAEKYPALLDKFLTQRNASWMKRLEQLLAGKEHVMVLVGTGHLGGPDGVIQLLRSKGYTVHPLSTMEIETR